ncbi:MAG TPA: tetratricopeptide repeat protein, partial [Vicinamibacteria bacterium]|nr:tetratricopeptide repeat protein [Vicinamibacteria bacterium]
PDGAAAGRRIAGTVGLVDLPATLLELAGLDPAGLDGRSLRPDLERGRTEGRPVYAETLFPRYHFGWSELFSVTEPRYRYIRAPRPELFDTARDPRETTNIAPQHSATVAAMDRWLQQHVGAVPAAKDVPAETRERLQALGYIGGGSGPVLGGERPDPKDKIGSYEELKQALKLRQDGRNAEAVEGLRKVLADNPAMLDAWEVLGTTLLRMGRVREGIEALASALEVDPLRPTTHTALVRAYAMDGRRDLARQHAEIAAASDPGQGYEALAQLMMEEQRLELAAEFARKSLAADPRRVMSHFVVGVAAQEAGRHAEALAAYRRAEEAMKARKHAILRGLHARMATCLGHLGREAEAEREFLAELQAVPYSREGRQGLAALYWSQGRDAEARAVLTGLIETEPRPTADTYWTVVHTFSVLGDVESARLWAARARGLFPDDPRFRGRT